MERMTYTFDSRCLWRGGKPWFPVMGEIHYSRVPAKDWKKELAKMKAGGVDLISAYSIWIHHEEEEEVYDFSGERDLRAFLEAVRDLGLPMILRIGPWVHAEARNGGLPDWLVEKERRGELALRTNDPAYLALVRTWYKALFDQARGLLWSDGGPVIGVQIENEYGHCGGLTGPEGEAHMKTLTAMAKEAGFVVPLYTATGWGGAVTGGLLPVMGGYCESPWDPRVTEIEPSGNYIFTAERNDHAIGSDHGLGEGITFDMDAFPYLTAELGGGLQVTSHRRPVATGRDTEAMSLVKMGSGCVLLGYYMYHGGTNPEGRLTTLQESRETGYPNDLPVLSYDFNAPVREYGQLTDSWRRLRRIGLFLKDFGPSLALMPYADQPGNPGRPEDREALRTAVRTDGKSGYLFVSAFQRRQVQKDHPEAALKAYGPADGKSPGALLADFGTETVRNGDCFFYPFGLPLPGGAVLETAHAMPLALLGGGKGSILVLRTREGITDPAIRLKGDLGEDAVLTLTDAESLRAAKVSLAGRDHLILSEADLVTEEDGALCLIRRVRDRERLSFMAFPALEKAPEGFTEVRKGSAEISGRTDLGSGDFALYRASFETVNPCSAVMAGRKDPETGEIRARIRIQGLNAPLEGELDEALLVIDYEGDRAELAQRGEPLRKDGRAADSFYTGQSWEVGLSRFAGPDGEASFDLAVHPLREDAPVFLETWPDMEEGLACRVQGIHTEALVMKRLEGLRADGM